MDGSEPRLLENSEGFRTTPSMVAFTEEGERLVGIAAKRQMDTNATNTIFGVKRLMGKSITDPEVEQFRQRVSFKIVKSPKDNEAWVEANGRSYSPAEIQGFVLSQEVVERYFGKKASKTINPDEVVATGVAFQTGVLIGEASSMTIQDVTPLSLGLETNGAVMTTFIPKNSPLPSVKSRIVLTAEDNQTQLELKVLQGERTMASHNRSLGSVLIEGIEPRPRGEVSFKVTFSVNTQGMATIKAKNLLTGEITTGEIDPTATGDEIEALMSDHQATWVGDAKRSRLMKLRGETDSLMVKIETMIRKNKNIFDVWLPEEKEKLLDRMNTTKILFSNPSLEEIPMRRHFNSLQKLFDEVWKEAEVGKSRYELYGHDERNEGLRPRDMGWLEYLKRELEQARKVNKENP
eukprot:TRINITY_DN7106_c0_g1_i3.p1 TRINITY_DN7106_c0_g1~~TRINITY_DN7106_c0_g1_i3.p1  ORF type:complete len:406 (-),score=84.87 TRINITY_DN7106_c0_g1_i3:9-1226(-)